MFNFNCEGYVNGIGTWSQDYSADSVEHLSSFFESKDTTNGNYVIAENTDTGKSYIISDGNVSEFD